MKRYKCYKSSGVEWLGEIPEHWELKKLKYVAAVNPSKSSVLAGVDKELPVTFLPMEKVSENGSVETDIKKPVKELINGFTFFKECDVIVAKITPCFENGKGAYLENLDSPFGFGSTEFHVLRGHDQLLLNEYLYFVTKSNLFMEFGEGSMTGAGGQKRVPTSFLQEYLIAYPKSLHEQRVVVDFIKSKTSQIDYLIRKKQQMIALLEEEKTAFINESVTKGLNPNAPMKDSGIEWLGMVPEHYQLVALKHLVKTKITDGPHETPVFVDEGVPFISAEAVKNGKIDFNFKRGFITEEVDKAYSKKCKPQRGDIFIVKSGSTTGKVAIVETDENFNIWSPLALVRAKEFMSSLFLYYALSSQYFQKTIQLSWSFGTQPNIGMNVIENLRVVVPPYEEQTAIADMIAHELDAKNAVISKHEKEIYLIQEYRTALISEAVTGKIDVRDYQPEPIASSALA